jgi:ATP-dependent Clp protease ATP-binding subunit ClpB
MRFDKFTTKFQQAVSDAQSLAVGNDQQFIEPQHLLLALLNQDDGSTTSLLQRAGANVGGLKAALAKALERLPRVEGHGGEVSIGRDLTNLLNLTDKEAQKRGDQFIASKCSCSPLARTRATGRLLKEAGVDSARPWKRRSRPCAAAKTSVRRKPKASARR